jgi:hypothetical protein
MIDLRLGQLMFPQFFSLFLKCFNFGLKRLFFALYQLREALNKWFFGGTDPVDEASGRKWPHICNLTPTIGAVFHPSAPFLQDDGRITP